MQTNALSDKQCEVIAAASLAIDKAAMSLDGLPKTGRLSIILGQLGGVVKQLDAML